MRPLFLSRCNSGWAWGPISFNKVGAKQKNSIFSFHWYPGELIGWVSLTLSQVFFFEMSCQIEPCVYISLFVVKYSKQCSLFLSGKFWRFQLFPEQPLIVFGGFELHLSAQVKGLEYEHFLAGHAFLLLDGPWVDMVVECPWSVAQELNFQLVTHTLEESAFSRLSHRFPGSVQVLEETKNYAQLSNL